MEKQTNQGGSLVRLSQVEYESQPGQIDLMGWPVADSEGQEFGTLDDLLVDVETGEIPFASVCYGDKCTAIPLDVFYYDQANRRLLLPATKKDLDSAPDFSDKTDDIQPFVDYWDKLTQDWDVEYDEVDATEYYSADDHKDIGRS